MSETHGIAPWFGDWLRERTRRETTSDAPTWWEIVDRMGADAGGLLYTLLVVAHGRKRFDAQASDLLPLLAMSRPRFHQIVAQFVQLGLIAVKKDGGDAMEWTILREPQGWAQ